MSREHRRQRWPVLCHYFVHQYVDTYSYPWNPISASWIFSLLAIVNMMN